MNKILIKNANIVNRQKIYRGSVLCQNQRIKKIYREGESIPQLLEQECTIIDATNMYLLPGVIDDQVHFRDPGLTHKGDIASESKAAIAGGVTTYMDMPNTNPQTTTVEAINNKLEHASQTSYANYAFYLGATNNNIEEIKKADKSKICGVKVFMGSSTGNMLVDDKKALSAIFAEAETLVAAHCESESIIKQNLEHYKKLLGENIPIKYHPLIRSEEACYRSSSEAAELATKYNTQFHILHLSTAKEVSIFDVKPLENKKITGEVCVHHLWFSDQDYEKYGSRIKWNPAVKTINDRAALMEGIRSGKLDVIATDHAPHLLSEKEGGCLTAASGGPLVQHSLQMMLELHNKSQISLEEIVQKMSHNPAILFKVVDRGFVDEGMFADLVLVKKEPYTVSSNNILYKCGWSPLEGQTLAYSINTVILNGQIAFQNGEVNNVRGEMVSFKR